MSVKKEKGDPRGVFHDFYDDEKEAASLTIRADLMLHLREIIRKKKIAQKEAAKILGLTESRVSYIMKGRIDKFAIDKLIDMLAIMGYSVVPKIKKIKAA